MGGGPASLARGRGHGQLAGLPAGRTPGQGNNLHISLLLYRIYTEWPDYYVFRDHNILAIQYIYIYVTLHTNLYTNSSLRGLATLCPLPRGSPGPRGPSMPWPGRRPILGWEMQMTSLSVLRNSNKGFPSFLSQLSPLCFCHQPLLSHYPLSLYLLAART
uniref:Uncharacterized protein n=1 Tax=Pipistrellus kuhlii TaxID=59472 RepID=A0A7J7XV75_PIPKU|nr:hypothetical protein mPipKuh1_010500 [Pipistrellus kuhlii]